MSRGGGNPGDDDDDNYPFRPNFSTNSGGFNRVNRQAHVTNYGDFMKFIHWINSRDKLKSINPNLIFDHLIKFKRDMRYAPSGFPLKDKVNLFLNSFKEQANTLIEQFCHEQSILCKLASLELICNYLRDYFCSDILSQALELEYKQFKLKADDKKYRLFLITKHKKFLRLNNIDCLPQAVDNNPSHLFNRFKFSLVESTVSQSDLWNKLTDNLPHFSTFDQIDAFFIGHQDKTLSLNS